MTDLIPTNPQLREVLEEDCFRKPAPIIDLTPEVIANLNTLLDKVQQIASISGLPWRMGASSGKPLLYGGAEGRGALMAYGTIGSWPEIELVISAVNALPALLAAHRQAAEASAQPENKTCTPMTSAPAATSGITSSHQTVAVVGTRTSLPLHEIIYELRGGSSASKSADENLMGDAADFLAQFEASAQSGEREAMGAALASVWRQARENHERYSHTGDVEGDIRFLALGLTGEAGELANFVKKRWRDGEGHDDAIRKEIADVCAYAFMLADRMGQGPTDLINVIAEKQALFIAKMEAIRAPRADIVEGEDRG